MDIFERIHHLRQQRRSAVLVTLVDTHGSTPRKPGAHMLLYPDGAQEGTIGGGKVEHVLREAAQRVLASGRPELIRYELTAELAMCCGGKMSFFVEPIMSQPILMVFGCGHVGTALIHAAAQLGFEVVAVDSLEANTAPERIPQATRCINSYEAEDLQDLPFGDDTYVVIATREHALDEKLMELCLEQPARFVGVIGSPRKARVQRERLAAKGFTDDVIARVHCPVGLDIGAQTPEEIAVAICAELISVRRGGPRFAERECP